MNCGTSQSGVPLHGIHQVSAIVVDDYDFHYGETDLHESELRPVARTYLVMLTSFVIMVIAGGLLLALAPSALESLRGMPLPFAAGESDTPTPRPTLSIPSVTPAPPTPIPSSTNQPTALPTDTPEPEPCIQEVLPDDGLYAIVRRCGHRDVDVLDIVVELNNLPDVNTIRLGQQIIVPWPTPTVDPNAVATETPTGEPESVGQVSAFDPDFDPDFVPTATLQPDLQYHEVQPNENIISIGVQYGIGIEVLSQLNPEVSFSQCDFGETFGGEGCTVFLREGQFLRVPAPTATPTFPPTATGNETATPTPTATFNAPELSRPSDRAFFRSTELITLRWVPSGTLGENETYQVRVEDVTTGIVYVDTTRDISYIVPEAWRGREQPRHEYRWRISVVAINDPSNPRYTTEEKLFFWEGRQSE